jgi:hypothetical protein
VGIYLWAKRRGANRGRVELAAPMDAKPVYPMTSAQQGVSGNGYPDQYKAYQPPPPQPPIQQHNAIHEISPQSQGYPAEMDGGAGKGKGMV